MARETAAFTIVVTALEERCVTSVPLWIRMSALAGALRRGVEVPFPGRSGKDGPNVRYFVRLPTTTTVVLGLPYTHGWQALAFLREI